MLKNNQYTISVGLYETAYIRDKNLNIDWGSLTVSSIVPPEEQYTKMMLIVCLILNCDEKYKLENHFDPAIRNVDLKILIELLYDHYIFLRSIERYEQI